MHYGLSVKSGRDRGQRLGEVIDQSERDGESYV